MLLFAVQITFVLVLLLIFYANIGVVIGTAWMYKPVKEEKKMEWIVAAFFLTVLAMLSKIGYRLADFLKGVYMKDQFFDEKKGAEAPMLHPLQREAVLPPDHEAVVLDPEGERLYLSLMEDEDTYLPATEEGGTIYGKIVDKMESFGIRYLLVSTNYQENGGVWVQVDTPTFRRDIGEEVRLEIEKGRNGTFVQKKSAVVNAIQSPA